MGTYTRTRARLLDPGPTGAASGRGFAAPHAGGWRNVTGSARARFESVSPVRMARPTVLLCTLALAALAASGCGSSAVTFRPVPSAVAVPAGEVARGDGLYPFRGPDGRWGYMEADGAVAIAPAFDAADVFSEGRAAVRVGPSYGYADPSGRLAVPAEYAEAAAFSQDRGLVAVGSGGGPRYGFVDPAGVVVVPAVLLQAYPYADGRALVRLRDKAPTPLERLFGASDALGFLDRDGALAFTVPGQASSFAEGLAPFSDPGAFTRGDWGYLQPDGSVAVELRSLRRAYGFSDGLARVVRGDEMGYVRPDGSPAFAATFEVGGPFSEGLAPVLVDRQWGYVDAGGALAIAPRFDQAGAFSGGLAAVEVGGRWGYVGPDGGFVIEPRFAAAQTFRGPLAAVTDATGTYYVDRAGQPVRPRLPVR